jgi:hypothetical protein
MCSFAVWTPSPRDLAFCKCRTRCRRWTHGLRRRTPSTRQPRRDKSKYYMDTAGRDSRWCGGPGEGGGRDQIGAMILAFVAQNLRLLRQTREVREPRRPAARAHAHEALLCFPMEGLCTNVARLAFRVIRARLSVDLRPSRVAPPSALVSLHSTRSVVFPDTDPRTKPRLLSINSFHASRPRWTGSPVKTMVWPAK